MNKLDIAKRIQILNMLIEGSSMRSVSRVADVSINTVAKLLADAGVACARFHYSRVQNVSVRRVQCDEIWSFCYAKQKNVAKAKAAPEQAGDVWTWTALDPDSKMILSWMVGGRDAETANFFMDDLASRLANRVQLTTDGNKTYLEAVAGAFADTGIDYAMLVKHYGQEGDGTPERRYSPAEFVTARKERITGSPNESHISTSLVERHNLTMRMSMRRFTRLTNAFSKKIDSHIHALAIYFVHYNFMRIHKTLRVTPAMAAGVSERLMSWEDLLTAMDAEVQPKKRGPYKKKAA